MPISPLTRMPKPLTIDPATLNLLAEKIAEKVVERLSAQLSALSVQFPPVSSRVTMRDQTRSMIEYLEEEVSRAPITGIPLKYVLGKLEKDCHIKLTLNGLESAINRTRAYHKLSIRNRKLGHRADALVERLEQEHQQKQKVIVI